MFNIFLYHMSTENNRMDKTNYLTQIAELQGTFREETSVINPSITFEFTQNMSDLENGVLDCNYLYIPYFKRYYFVDNIIAVSDKLWEIDCSVDVLMSFKEQLGELDVFCDRNEYNYDDMLIDDKVPSLNKQLIGVYESDLSFIKFNEGFQPYFILSTAGYKSGYGYQETDYTNEISVPYIHYYLLTPEALFAFQKELFLASSSITTILNSYLINPSDCIRSITVFPIDVNDFIIKSKTTDTIICSDKDIPLKDANNESIYIKDITQRKVATFTMQIPVSSYYNNFLDYEPYTKIELFIPFIGKIDLETDICMGKSVIVSYSIDCETGSATVKVYTNDNPEVILFTNDCQVGYSIPIIRTNLSEQVRGITSALVGLIGGAVSGIAGGSAIMASSLSQSLQAKSGWLNTEHKTPTMRKGYQAKQNAIKTERNSNIVVSATNFISSNTVDILNSMKGSISSGIMGDNSLTNLEVLSKIKLTIIRPNAYYPTGYNHLVGKPSKFTGKLKNIKGYTELSGFHLEGLKNCTSTEQSEINSVLRSGFLMPDP